MKKVLTIIKDYIGGIVFILVCVIVLDMYTSRIDEIRELEEANENQPRIVEVG